MPTHIEIDPDLGVITTWDHTRTELEEAETTDSCGHPALGGLRIEVSPAQARVWLLGFRGFIDTQTERHIPRGPDANGYRDVRALHRGGERLDIAALPGAVLEVAQILDPPLGLMPLAPSS